MKKRRSIGVTVFAWLLIGYFIYLVIFLIITVATSKMPNRSTGPAGTYVLLKWASVNTTSLNLCILSSIIQALMPLCGFIAGIGILRVKNWARKFITLIYSISLTSTLISLPIILTTPALERFAFREKHYFLVYVSFYIFEIAVIYFFTRPKVKEQFK